MRFTKTHKIESVCSDDALRPHLAHAYLDAGARRIVATNGHALAAIPVVLDDGDTTGFVPPDAIVAARKAAPKKTDQASLHANGACVVPNGPTFPRPDAGRFPEWKQVVPSYRAPQGKDANAVQTHDDEEKTVTFGIDASLLADLAAALGAAGKDSKCLAITLKLPKEGAALDPIIVQNTREPDAIGVIMPCRV